MATSPVSFHANAGGSGALARGGPATPLFGSLLVFAACLGDNENATPVTRTCRQEPADEPMPLTERTLEPAFTDVPGAVEEIRAGRMVVVVDDEDRENEGDLTLAAEHVTPEAINFMARYGRGLICLTLTEERLDHLRIGQ